MRSRTQCVNSIFGTARTPSRKRASARHVYGSPLVKAALRQHRPRRCVPSAHPDGDRKTWPVASPKDRQSAGGRVLASARLRVPSRPRSLPPHPAGALLKENARRETGGCAQLAGCGAHHSAVAAVSDHALDAATASVRRKQQRDGAYDVGLTRLGGAAWAGHRALDAGGHARRVESDGGTESSAHRRPGRRLDRRSPGAIRRVVPSRRPRPPLCVRLGGGGRPPRGRPRRSR
jgi:hypothetical protein